MQLTIPAAVARAASEFGDAAALVDPLAGPDPVSYRELGERVTAVTGALIEAGVEPGDRVALWAPNGCDWVLIALGALGAGAALVPVSTRFTGPEALDVISRSRARALFVAGDFLGVDRLGTLLAAAAEAPAAAGDGTLGRLGLVVRVPDEWDAFMQGGSLAEAAGGRCWPRPAGGRCWPRPPARWPSAGGPYGRETSATSCSPRARPGGARAR